MESVAAMAQAGWAAHRRRGFIAVEAAASAFLPAGKRGDQVTRLRRLVPQELDINLYEACAPRETSTRCSMMHLHQAHEYATMPDVKICAQHRINCAG